MNDPLDSRLPASTGRNGRSTSGTVPEAVDGHTAEEAPMEQKNR